MKLVRYSVGNDVAPGLIDEEGRIRELRGEIHDICGKVLDSVTLARLAGLAPKSMPLAPTHAQLVECVAGVSKFVCVGLNYADHAREAGRSIPQEPVLFMKATSAICGPFDDILVPGDSAKTDWEVELGIVIGQVTRRIEKEAAFDHIAGYCVVDDLSERAYQSERGGQWVKGKSLDTYGPIGPWLVTRDEIPEPQSLSIWQEVDGKRYQDGNTADMIFKVDEIVSYVSQFMTLLPGDIIATGTPAGVGMGQKPEPVYLGPGQTLRLGIDGLGEQTHTVALAEY